MNDVNPKTQPVVKRKYTSWKKILGMILEAKRSTQIKVHQELGKHLAKRKVNPAKLAKLLKQVAVEQGYDSRELKIKVK
jgi:hypothetical protein